MFTEALFMTTAPQVLEAVPTTTIPGIECVAFGEDDGGRPFLKLMMS
jgi:hypothetical protein